MAKKIIEMVRAKRDELQAGTFDEAEDFARLAVAAIKDGVKSRAWQTYMLQFVETVPNDPTKPLDPRQLARLLADDGSLGDRVLDRRRGYILSNGMCGGGSPMTEHLDAFVDTIDSGLAGGCIDPNAPLVNIPVDANAAAASPASGAKDGEAVVEDPKQ